jgi:hypothetical protein
MRRFSLIILILFLTSPVYSLRKPFFGGNLRIADTLINEIDSQPIFEVNGEEIKALIPVPVEIQQQEVRLDFSGLNPDWVVELEKSVAAIQDPQNSCHWILDYPYFDHRHPNKLQMESGVLVIQSEEPDFLQAILTSPCLPPSGSEPLQAYRRTQFGFEANTNCISGRPFLDSITPTPVDAANPYLSFKLNDVDVLPVPEERFQQISTDTELNVVEGPSYFVYLITSNMDSEKVLTLISKTRIGEIAKVVLNDHAELILTQQSSPNVLASPIVIEFQIPEEDPYRLLGERLVLEWKDLGFTPAVKAGSANSKIEIVAQEVSEKNQDLFRYNLLRSRFNPSGNQPWFETWDEMETSGKLVPVLIHTTRIAARKNVVDLGVNGDSLDLADTWIVPEQQ